MNDLLSSLQFDGKDKERFKDNEEYRDMTDWIDVGGSAESTTWDKKAPLQGVYTAKKENVGPNESNMYTIKTTDGNVDVWGSTVIDSKFEQIPRGSEVRIEYLGMAKGKSGKEYADYKFQYREVPMIDVADASDEIKDIFAE